MKVTLSEVAQVIKQLGDLDEDIILLKSESSKRLPFSRQGRDAMLGGLIEARQNVIERIESLNIEVEL